MKQREMKLAVFSLLQGRCVVVNTVPIGENQHVNAPHNTDFLIHHCTKPTDLPLAVTAAGKFQLPGPTTSLSVFCLCPDPNDTVTVPGAGD